MILFFVIYIVPYHVFDRLEIMIKNISNRIIHNFIFITIFYSILIVYY